MGDAGVVDSPSPQGFARRRLKMPRRTYSISSSSSETKNEFHFKLNQNDMYIFNIHPCLKNKILGEEGSNEPTVKQSNQ